MTQYQAKRELLARGPEGNLVTYKPGDLIPDFEAWDIHARRANLSLEWVVPVEADKVVLEPPKVVPPKVETQGLAAKINEEEDRELEIFSCPKCSKGPFKTERALKTHIVIAHKD
jgi:hypothetical protein